MRDGRYGAGRAFLCAVAAEQSEQSSIPSRLAAQPPAAIARARRHGMACSASVASTRARERLSSYVFRVGIPWLSMPA
jgi:hypothetical protein